MRGTKRDVLYMEVTRDELALPVAFADSPRELAKICGVSSQDVISAISRAANLKRKSDRRERFICVLLDD